jgi:uncharacterized RDD family membrane protein YckC
VSVANLLMLIYLAVAIPTRGQRSVHDFIAGTFVREAPRLGRVPPGDNR